MRLVLIHIPCRDRRPVAATLNRIAEPHHKDSNSWLYPKQFPNVQIGWPADRGWPQTSEAEKAIVRAVGSDYCSLQVSMAVGSDGTKTLAVCAAVMRDHGGVAQIELYPRLWTLGDLETDDEAARTFLKHLVDPVC